MPKAMLVLMVMVLSVGVGGCESSDAQQSGAATWGPLAVKKGGPSGAEALLSGTLEITDKCVFLRDGEHRALVVWPSEGTQWDADSRTIRYEAEGRVDLRDGDSFSVGGGGSSVAESGVDDRAWVELIEWAAEPDPACFTSSRLFVGFGPKT